MDRITPKAVADKITCPLLITHRSKKEITMQDKRVALVTGANQGIGLQIAKDLVAHGFTVLVGSRSLERGEAAARRSTGTRARSSST
jgi:D-arabinose 1-dehydrogenase-like Zn-dependent alcohol dehydrogenase